jgi:hypothetical protein
MKHRDEAFFGIPRFKEMTEEEKLEENQQSPINKSGRLDLKKS